MEASSNEKEKKASPENRPAMMLCCCYDALPLLFPHPRTGQCTTEILDCAPIGELDFRIQGPDGKAEQNQGGGQKNGWAGGFFGGFGRISRIPAVDSVHSNAVQCDLVGHVVMGVITYGFDVDCRVLRTALGRKRLLRFHGAVLMPRE